MTQDHTNRLAIEPGMFDAADALTLKVAMQEKAKVEQTLILGAPKLLDMLGVGSFSLPIPGTDPVQYVAAGTLAEIERATRQQDALQQIADFGQEQDAAPAILPKLVSREEIEKAIEETEGQYFGSLELSHKQHGAIDVLVRCAQHLLAAAPAAQPAPVAAGLTDERIIQIAETWDLLSIQDGGRVDRSTLIGFFREAVVLASLAPVAAAPDQARLPGWERGIATVTMNGYQLREALDFINPDGDDDPEQRDNDLTFGIVQHKDDNGIATTGLCCWNDDTDGVLPLDTEPAAPSVEVKGEQGEMGGAA